jgi:hypothetical protein
LKFEYTDNNYYGRDHYFITVNKDYINLDINNIKTTITSKSVLGYNDNLNYSQGIGLLFSNSTSLISCAGLIIGNANNRVSDNVYGFTNPYDADFITVEGVSYTIPPLKGDQQITGIFNDNGALTQKLGVAVHANHYAWDIEGHKDYIILEYDIINNSENNLANIYAGFFADWELKVSSENKANTNFDEKFGYIFALDSSIYASIQLLSDGNFLHYAIDNNGEDGSVDFDDGFSTTEKFMTLSNTRLTAGNSYFGNDVSNVISTGPYSISSGDTINVSFAIHIANTYIELLQSIANAKE